MYVRCLDKDLVPADLATFYDDRVRIHKHSQTLKYRTDNQRRRFRRIVQIAQNLVTTYNLRHCLEVGCSTGLMTRALSKFCPYVHAVDIAPACIAQAPALESVFYQVADIETWDPQCEYDLVILSQTLEHLREPIHALRRLSNLSRFMIVSVPLDEPLNPESAFDTTRLGRELNDAEAAGHIWSMDWDGFLALAKPACGVPRSAERVGNSIIAVYDHLGHGGGSDV